MPRIRTIKPEFPQSESMGRVSRDARLCFLQLWTLADDAGRVRGNSRLLASLLYPYDEDAGDLIDVWLAELDLEGCTRRYKVGKDTYLEICNWLKHQKIDKPSKSKLPEFDESSRILANSIDESRSVVVGSKDLGSKDLRIKDRNVELEKPREDSGTISKVFEHWKTTFKHPKATLDQKRQKAIKEALKRYSPETLIESLNGYLNSPHHMGKNERNTVYDEITLLLRDSAHIDAGLQFFKNPPRPVEPKPLGPRAKDGSLLLSPAEIEARKLEKLVDRRAEMGKPHGFSMADFRGPNPGETSDDYRSAQDAEWSRRREKVQSYLRSQEVLQRNQESSS